MDSLSGLFPLIGSSFIIGIIILIISFYSQDSLETLLGVFTIKPAIATPLWAAIIGIYPPGLTWFSNITWAPSTLSIIPGVLLTISIIYFYRTQFTKKSARVFLMGDVLRWASTWFIFAGIFHSSEFYFYLIIFIATYMPTIYSVLALLYIIARKIILRKNAADALRLGGSKNL